MLVKIGHNLMVAGVKHGKCLTEIVFWDCDTNHFISSHLIRISLLAASCMLVDWPVLTQSLIDFAFSPFVPLSASTQRPEEVIQRYMEVVAGVQDEVNVSVFPPSTPRSVRNERKVHLLFWWTILAWIGLMILLVSIEVKNILHN